MQAGQQPQRVPAGCSAQPRRGAGCPASDEAQWPCETPSYPSPALALSAHAARRSTGLTALPGREALCTKPAPLPRHPPGCSKATTTLWHPETASQKPKAKEKWAQLCWPAAGPGSLPGPGAPMVVMWGQSPARLCLGWLPGPGEAAQAPPVLLCQPPAPLALEGSRGHGPGAGSCCSGQGQPGGAPLPSPCSGMSIPHTLPKAPPGLRALESEVSRGFIEKYLHYHGREHWFCTGCVSFCWGMRCPLPSGEGWWIPPQGSPTGPAFP